MIDYFPSFVIFAKRRYSWTLLAVFLILHSCESYGICK